MKAMRDKQNSNRRRNYRKNIGRGKKGGRMESTIGSGRANGARANASNIESVKAKRRK